MAAFYSLNGSDPIETEALAHSRSLSTLSSVPLLTNGTSDSHPTEPLLRSPLAPAAEYCEHSSQKLRNDDSTPAGLSRSPLNRTATPIAPKSLFRNAVHTFRRRTGSITLTLELIIGIWATYNTIRYFLAFLNYKNTLGQAFSLCFAITAGMSTVLTIWALALSTYISRHSSGQDGKKSHNLLLCMRILSAFLLLAPAVINVALVFVWKTPPNPELDLHARCHLDVDVVWSIEGKKCPIDAPPWPLWVALSIIRFLLTASFITIYLTASIFIFTPYSRRHSRWLHSDLGSNELTLGRITTLTDHHPSDLTLAVTLNSDSSPQRGQPRLVRSFDPSPDNFYGKIVAQEEDRGEMSGFVDRFRSLISQITREMEDTLEAARSDSPPFTGTSREYTSIPKPEFDDIDPNDDHDQFLRNNKDMFNLPPLPTALGYNEFGVPYPPEENVRVLGGFVRRMPTIESMGSGEVSRSSVTSHRHDSSAENRASSRSPTRTTFLTVSTTGHDGAGSNPPSRTNSFSGHAERLLRLSPIGTTSEHGELLGRIDRRLSNRSSGDFTFRSLSSTDDTMLSLESRGTATTYHTAAMGSYSPTSVYHDGTPVDRDI